MLWLLIFEFLPPVLGKISLKGTGWEFPYMVSIGQAVPGPDDHEFKCAGVIIDIQTILTGAVCFYEMGLNLEKLSVIVGLRFRDISKDSLYQKVIPSGIIIDPQYTKDENHFKFAIIKLKRPLKYSRMVQRINLPSDKFEKFYNPKNPSKRTGTIVAWETGKRSGTNKRFDKILSRTVFIDPGFCPDDIYSERQLICTRDKKKTQGTLQVSWEG